MSKKKRKTRAEKAVPKKHDFSVPTYKINKSITDDTKPLASQPKSEEIDTRVIADLKKVGIVIGLMILFLLIFSILVYKTDLLNQFFARFGVSY